MKTSLRILGAVLLTASVATVSRANPIEGWLVFTGAATLNAASASDATQASDWQVMPPTLVSDGGDFTSLGNPLPDANLQDPWNFTSNSVSTPPTPFDLLTIGGFTLTLENSWIANDSTPGWITVDGNGWLTEGALGPTWTTVSFVFHDPVSLFTPEVRLNPLTVVSPTTVDTFTATITVPDGGMTAALLGASMLALTIVGRRRSVKA